MKRTLGGTLTAIAVVGLATGACFVTYEHDLVLHEDQSEQWSGLDRLNRALTDGRRPQDADASVFLSNAALNKALQSFADAVVEVPTKNVGVVSAIIKNLRINPDIGMSRVAIDLTVASPGRNLRINMSAEGDLVFRGVKTVRKDDGRSQAVAEFGITLVKAQPHLDFGFMDLPGRRLVDETLSSGLLLAVDRHLNLPIPFEDHLALNTAYEHDDMVPTSAGSVVLRTSLPGSLIEQRFSMATPLFLKTGVWLMAAKSKTGQTALPRPTAPHVSRTALAAEIAGLRERVGVASKDMEQQHDIVLNVKGDALVGLAGQIGKLPVDKRTVTVRSIATTGQLASDGNSYVELRDPTSAVANLVLRKVDAAWVPNEGTVLSVDVDVNLQAKIHAHARPIKLGGGAGTTVMLNGRASKTVSATLGLQQRVVAGHSLLFLEAAVPCDSIRAEVKTDGRLEVGGFKTDLFSIGVRWNVPLPPEIGQPNLVLDDLPHRFELKLPAHFADGSTLKLRHGFVEFTTHVANAEAMKDGYRVLADLDMHPVDGAQPEAVRANQQKEIGRAVAAARGSACPSVEQDFSAIIGDVEIGDNNAVLKFLGDVAHDLTEGLGDHNDLVGSKGAVMTTIDKAVKDVTQGPGHNNEIFGGGGWAARTFGW